MVSTLLRQLQQRAQASCVGGNPGSAIMYEVQAEAVLQLANKDSSYLPVLAGSFMRQGMDRVGQEVLGSAEQKLRQAERLYRRLAWSNPPHRDLANVFLPGRVRTRNPNRRRPDRAALMRANGRAVRPSGAARPYPYRTVP